ncbi:MAG TPA: alpha/beta hydrolase, partial [Solirubrobacterales bacterium]
LEALTVEGILEHLESVVAPLEQPPILIGHSAGGVFTQLLLDRGFGAAAVAINSAPTEGVRVLPPSQLKATFSILSHPSTRHEAVPLTPEQWHYAFATTLDEEGSRELYDRYHVPASGAIFWESVLANVKPGHQATHVDYHNDERAPLLFMTGSEDNLMPPGIQHSNAKHYKSDTVTEVVDFEGRDHATIATPGWEEVADRALSWAREQAAARAA